MSGFLVRAISNLNSKTAVRKVFNNLVQLQLRCLEKIGQLPSVGWSLEIWNHSSCNTSNSKRKYDE